MQSLVRTGQGGLATRLRTRARMLRAIAPPAQYGVSYPKSGRTWLRAMIGKVLCGRTGLSEQRLLETHRLTAAAGLPVLKWHHGGGKLKHPCHRHDALVFDESEFAGKPALFLVRDPRDTLISAYFHALKREQVIDEDISAFIRSSERGILKWIAYHELWYAHRNRMQSFHLVRYEDLHRDPVRTLHGALVAIGLKNIEAGELEAAVEFARFDNLRLLESGARMRSRKLRPKDAADPDSFKVRKGKVGGYRDALGPEDIEFIEDALRRYPCALFQEHYGVG